ncbi:MAG: polymer-forming cytoskeletal protein [Patescibacteria group bacterium]|nr:polymer-forming cytoskeletal protein [Patescibacteria group bacterium]
MSDQKSYSANGSPHSATVIAHGVKVEGDFTSQGDVTIEGEVQGKVSTSGMLNVGPRASLKADIAAEKAIVAGAIEGNLQIGSHIDIKATAKIAGDLDCGTATVESGATLCGKVTIGRPAKVSDSIDVSDAGAAIPAEDFLPEGEIADE